MVGSKDPKYRGSFCHNFLLNKPCNKIECSFSHDIFELKKNNPAFKTEPCNTFLESGMIIQIIIIFFKDLYNLINDFLYILLTGFCPRVESINELYCNFIHYDDYDWSLKKFEKEYKTIFVGGLPQDAKDPEIREYFSKYGEINVINLKTDQNTGRSRGFAFVVFKSVEGVDAVCAEPNHTVKNKKVDVKKVQAKQRKIEKTDISITEQVMKKQLDSKGEKSILREEKREPDLEISNPSPIFNSTRKSFEAEENELENHSDVTSKKNPLATIKNKPSTKVVEKSLTKKIVEPPISTAIVTTIQETQDSDIGVAIDQNEPNKQPVKETLESPNHSITSSIKSQELLEDNEIAVVALVGQKTKDSFKRETGPPDLDDLSNVVSPVNKSSKSSEKKKKKGLSISGNKDSSYLVPPRPPNNTLNTSNFQEIVSPNALVVTKPTQKRFFKTYEKNKGPSSFFVKPAVSDMGDDKKKKFDIFDPVR